MIERTFIEQGIRRMELEEYLRGQLYRAGFTGSEVIKTPLVTRIVIHVTNPGLAIGKSGQNIKSLTQEIQKRFKIDDPQLEIEEIKIPELNAAAMADKMKTMIERGFSWRSVSYRTVRDVMKAGAQGVELIMKGKLAGKGGRKRKLRIAEGYMKKVGEQARLVDMAKATAYPKAGAIGITMRIVRPETIFPDKMRIGDFDLEQISGEEEGAEKVGEEQIETKAEAEKGEAAKEEAVSENKTEGDKEVKEERKTAGKQGKEEGEVDDKKNKGKEKKETDSAVLSGEEEGKEPVLSVEEGTRNE